MKYRKLVRLSRRYRTRGESANSWARAATQREAREEETIFFLPYTCEGVKIDRGIRDRRRRSRIDEYRGPKTQIKRVRG